MRIKNKLYFILVIFVFSCSQNKESTINYIATEKGFKTLHYNENGGLVKISNFDSDSILNGETITLNEHQKIIRKKHYINGKLNGFDSIFYSSGNLKSVKQWNDDFLINSSYTYYDSIISSLATNGRDTLIIRIPKIEKYFLFNSYGKPSFEVEFGKDNEIKNSEGNSIASIYYNRVNKKIYLKLAYPPYFSSRVEISLCSNIIYSNNRITNEDYVIDLKDELLSNNDCLIIKHVLKCTEKGINYTIQDKIKVTFSEELQKASLKRYK